jgi:hypothetical protein
MLNFIKNVDFLGKHPQTYIFKQSCYKTQFGGFMSILTLLSMAALSLYFIINLFTGTDLNLITSTTNKFEKKINLGDIPIFFKPTTSNGDRYDTRLVYPIFQIWNYYPENGGTPNITTIPFKNCEKDNIKSKYEGTFTNFSLSEYYCLDNKSNITLFGSNGDITNGYSKINIYLAKCTNNSALNPNPSKNNCKPLSDINASLSSSPAHFYFIYSDNNVVPENREAPFLPYIKTEDFRFPLSALYKFQYYFKKTFIISDYGWMFEDKVEVNDFQYDNFDSLAYIGSSFSIKEAFGLISFTLSDNADVYKRSYIKMQTLVANIGGIINFLLIIAKTIVKYITNKLFIAHFIHKPMNINQQTKHLLMRP